MPFYGRDWRSTGELWVKTERGWEKNKLIPSPALHAQERKQTASARDSSSLCDGDDKENGRERQPYVPIIMSGAARETTGYTTLADAFLRLDLHTAASDVRRYNYICKVLYCLTSDNMSSLSGSAQKLVLQTINEVIQQAVSSQQNTGQMRRLLDDTDQAVQQCYKGRHIGCKALWQQHMLVVERWRNAMHGVAESEAEQMTEVAPVFIDLPLECLRLILLRLSDHKDLLNAAKISDQLGAIVCEQQLWRQLVLFHFTKAQIDSHMTRDLSDREDWRGAYLCLRRKHGERETFAEMLRLCLQCRCLFWPSRGHPCVSASAIAPDEIDHTADKLRFIDITPDMFVRFFSL